MTDARALEIMDFLPPPSERVGIEAYWTVYDGNRQRINEEIAILIEADPKLGPIVAAMPPDPNRAESQEANYQLLKNALLNGAWEPYISSIRKQGAAYAFSAIEFPMWFSVIRLFRTTMRPKLFEAYANDPDRLAKALVTLSAYLDLTVAVIGDEYLRSREKTIRQQQEAILELSTPVLQVRPGLLILPIVGLIDSYRARQLTEQLLESIGKQRARAVVLDLTGVPAVDSAVANHLLQTVEAARLLGARAVVTGLSTVNAQTLVRIGVDLSNLNTAGDLQDGLEQAENWLARFRSPDEQAPVISDR